MKPYSKDYSEEEKMFDFSRLMYESYMGFLRNEVVRSEKILNMIRAYQHKNYTSPSASGLKDVEGNGNSHPVNRQDVQVSNIVYHRL